MPKYDIACIGAGMAGLAAAALLTRAGRSVCLMDPADSAGGSVAAREIAGFRFTAGPAITYGFEPGGVLQKLFSDLELSASASGSFPGYQVVMPDHRITVSGDPRETEEELIREFPGETGVLAKLYRDVRNLSVRSSKSRLSSYLLRLRNAAAYLRSYRFGGRLLSYFDVQSRFFFGSSLPRLPLSSLVLMLTTAPQYFPGGFARLADQLLSIVQQQNGTWYHGEPFPELLLRGNRITGIGTSRGVIEPRTVLMDVPGERSEPILFLGIRDEVVPVGMLPYVLCLSEGGNGDYFTLSLSPVDDGLAAPSGMRSMTAAFPPALEVDRSVDAFVDRITPVVPFLQDFQVAASLQDPHARRFSFPPAVKVHPYEYRVGRPMLTPCSVKNLKIVPDSVRTPLPAVFTAQTIVEKLK